MITSYFDALLDGEAFIVLDPDYFYRQDGTYYVFEKTCPHSFYSGRQSAVLNAKRMSDECYCTIPGHLPVVRVAVLRSQFLDQWDFEGAKKEEPRIEIDYGDFKFDGDEA